MAGLGDWRRAVITGMHLRKPGAAPFSCTTTSGGLRQAVVTTYTPRMERSSYFPALDGLRALSVLLVIYYHADNKTVAMNRLQGKLGVDVFFVLSGFLITFLLNREQRENGKVDLVAFYVRRAFRILPIYTVVLAIYVLLTRFSAHGAKWHEMKRELPYFLTFCNELVPGFHHGPFTLTWTLGVEEKFYLVWPFLFFVALAATRWRAAMAATLYLFLVVLSPESYRFGPRSYSGLLVGCFLALALTDSRIAKPRQLVARMPAAVPLLALSVGFYLVDLHTRFMYLFSWCVFLFVAHLLLAPSWIRTFLSQPVLVWFGKRSYGMYLIHGLVLDLVQSRVHVSAPIGPAIVVFCSFIVAALASDLLYRFIESPAREYGKKLLAQRIARTKNRSSIPSLAPPLPSEG
jgi:peptidoglycan/LPS O-acetylase OafA/YrhL